MIRKALVKDAKRIQELVNFYAEEDLMLPRSLNEIYENIRDFFIYENKGRIVACCALHVSWEDLAEIKSLAVDKTMTGKGIGKELVLAALDEAKKLKVKEVFALTYIPKFFEKFKFKRVNKSKLPHKIWSECIRCPKFPECDEVPLVLKLRRK